MDMTDNHRYRDTCLLGKPQPRRTRFGVLPGGKYRERIAWTLGYLWVSDPYIQAQNWPKPLDLILGLETWTGRYSISWRHYCISVGGLTRAIPRKKTLKTH